MKRPGRLSTGVLLLLLGTVAPTYAQQVTLAPDSTPLVRQPPGPDTKQQLAKGLFAGAVADPARSHPRRQAARPSLEGLSAEQVVQRELWQQGRARSWQAQHRTWQQRGGYSGSRIPEEEFRAYYGREHTFRISRLPSELVGGRVRFQYGRYWFALFDRWPEYWPDNWYETDDVYINYYDDGYYLFNQSRPGVRAAVEVVPD